MPRLSQWLIHTAFVYLLLGFTLGALLLTHKGLPLHPALWEWLPAHMEFLLIGWIVQLTMGVAFWVLPRYWKKPRRPKEIFAQIAFVLLNLGIWLVVAGTTFQAGRGFLLTGRVVEVGAVGFFTLHAWKRIVSREGA
jgi:heme/copper-type cytochrome/quinol oxidase subunit 1